MLDIIASYHCMQFQGKQMKQTWENDSFSPNFGPFGPNMAPQKVFPKIWLRQSLDIQTSYHHVEYQEKLMI